MSWEKGLISVGGETQGQVLKITPTIWAGYTCGSNTYNTFTMNDDHLFSAFPIDLDWSGPSIATNKLFFKIAKKDVDGNVTGFIAFRYSYEKGVNSQGRVFLTVRGDLGYMDLQGNYTSVHGIPDVTQSIGGTSIYQFKAWCHICFDIRNGENLFGVAIQVEDTVNSDFDCRGVITTQSFVQGISYSEKSYSPEYGEGSEEKGGYNDGFPHGSFDDSSDTITYSSKPTLSVGNSGFVHAYVVNEQILQAIGTALFPRIESQSFTGIPEAIDYLTMVMFFNKRTDYIMDMLILPITVPSGSATRVKVGGSELVVQDGEQQVYCMAYPVTEYYVDFDCGSISIPEYWRNFLDFTGTRFKLFLPAVGYVDLQGEFINGGEINVKYRFNIVDGSFMCVVTSTSGHSNLSDSLIAQYSGVWAMHIPITGQDYTNKISGLISSVGSVAAGGLMGGGVGAVAAGVSGLANTAMQKPQTTHANGYNASSSFLTHRKPYLIIERQSSQFSTKYPSENGLPCYVAKQLSSVHGFTIIENPVLNIACSDREYNELVQLLKSGIIL